MILTPKNHARYKVLQIFLKHYTTIPDPQDFGEEESGRGETVAQASPNV